MFPSRRRNFEIGLDPFSLVSAGLKVLKFESEVVNYNK